ncbi:MAG: HEPN domain-containing protein [Stellaceae bacterium]
MNYHDAAGRTAYLAGFHAAQASISERTGRAVETHGGVNTEFHRLVRNDARIGQELRAFLGFAYSLKAIADYETGPGSEVPPELAAEAVAAARRLVAKMAELVEAAAGSAARVGARLKSHNFSPIEMSPPG